LIFFIFHLLCSSFPSGFYTFRANPLSPTKTRLDFEIFISKSAPENDIRSFIKYVETIANREREFCEDTQRNMTRGVFYTGKLHLETESGIIHHQRFIKHHLTDHFEKEVQHGQEIFYASRKL